MDGVFPSAAHDSGAATDGTRRRRGALCGADLSDLYPASGGGGGGGGDGGDNGSGRGDAMAMAMVMVVAMAMTIK